LALATLAGFAISCAVSPDSSAGRRPANSSPSSSGAGSTALAGTGAGGSIGVDNPEKLPVASPAGSAANTGGTIAGAIVDAGAPDAPLTANNSCGNGKAEAKLKPVNMFVMFDRSGSMEDDDKWTNASSALSAFFRDPGVAGMRVALRFFPHDSPSAGCSKDGCDPVACSQPLVPIGELSAEPAPTDTQERALVDAVANSAPGGGGNNGGTPIYAALDGALRWATSYAAMHTDENTVVVFVTDGEPNGCDEDFDHISALAAQALTSSHVTTYAIGLKGSNADQMDQLAQAGGTMQGIFVDVGASAEQQLITALNAIRGQALSCDFPMPEPSDPSMTIDPTRVNVTFTPSTGKAGTLAQVTDQNSCGTNKSWFYDVPQKPTRINLCPSACDLVRADSKAVLEILIGCATACGGLDMSCGGGPPPPPEVPPVIF
jgi:Mg-chelatase subunit ChlD